ncbi:MAG: N-acetyl-gamma-glutamyl-phosphate reductase [Candidatus Bathyarchaeia archaeon]|jgi:N-acetyl-gamma-glutamyl-phosphate/LysW-gamma-L-alpha-aminoadipyl-6-phosphate reductase
MKVGIIGGSGYVGGELLRLLLPHPDVELTTVTSRANAGEYVFTVHPNLRAATQLKFTPPNIANVTANCDLVFAAMPHGKSVELVPELVETGVKVIDMSADYRLRNPADYDKWYGWKHTHPDLLAKAVYGCPELHREEIKNAQLIGCPGCMATATIMGLAPLVNASAIEEDRIVADVKIGSSGAGQKPTVASHHPERAGGVRPYKVMDHRHIAEVEQELNLLTDSQVTVAFTPHAVNMIRGILSTIHAFLKKPLDVKDVWKMYRGLYQNEHFVRFVKFKKGPYQLPDPKINMGTNFVDIGFELDPRTNRIIVFSAIDNLMRGASGQGVQCMNIMLGFDETTGLECQGFHPM